MDSHYRYSDRQTRPATCTSRRAFAEVVDKVAGGIIMGQTAAGSTAVIYRDMIGRDMMYVVLSCKLRARDCMAQAFG